MKRNLARTALGIIPLAAIGLFLSTLLSARPRCSSCREEFRTPGGRSSEGVGTFEKAS